MDANLKNEIKLKMDRAMESLSKTLKGFNTGRASPSLVENIRAESYGTVMPISQLSTVTVTDARSLNIQIWDKSMVKAVEKAIYESNLGLTPSVEGTNIRINIPPLNEERRKEISKHVKTAGEDSKVIIRNIRRDAKESFKKLGVSEDLAHKYEDELQKITEEYNKKIDKQIEDKIKEVMTL